MAPSRTRAHAVPGLAKQRTPVLLLLTAILGGCGGEQTGPAEPGGVPVTVVNVTPTDTPVSFEFVGQTESSRKVEIRSRVSGFLERRHYQEGSIVQEGDILFQMDAKPFEAQLQAARAELTQQEARLVTARANLARIEPLAKKNAVAQKELDDALGQMREAAAAVEAAKAKVIQAELDLSYTTITTPVTGITSFANQQEGAYIGLGQDSLLTYVAQLSPMRINFSVSENQILRSHQETAAGRLVEPGDAGFEVEIVLADGSIYPHTGRITFADASLSPETGTFLIRAEVDNTENKLRPGQFVRARLKGAIRPDAIIVPQRAVQQGAKGSFVWVVDDEGKAQFRPVEVGSWKEDDWFIASGLQGGETVVVGGALKLRAGVPVQITEPDASAETDGQ